MENELNTPAVVAVGRVSISSTASRRLGLVLCFLLFEGVMVAVSILKPDFKLTGLEWVQLVLAGCLLGAAVAYLDIGEFMRWPVTKTVKHPSGYGEYTTEKYEGFWSAPGSLLSCPICAGIWSSAALLYIMAFWPQLGHLELYIFSAGACIRLIVRLCEALEMQRDLIWEQVGKLVKARS